MTTDDPNAARRVIIDYSPRRYFVPFHERYERFACIVAHRRAGKTTACIHEMQKGVVLCKKPRPRFAYIAPLLKQAKTVAWDIAKGAASNVPRTIPHEGELRVDYSNGGQMRLFGADNPDALRGIGLDGAVIDEPAQQDPRLWEEIINPALADRLGWAVFIGTPKGRDAFYKVWRNAETSLDWYSVRLPASRTKIIPQVELQRAQLEMSPAQYAREFECSFDEPDIAQFIDGETIEAARSREGKRFGPKIMGVDIARMGDDRTVILKRNGTYIDPDDGITVLRIGDLMQVASRVNEEINRWKPQFVCVDGVGIGAGVVDRLRQIGHASIIDVNGGNKAGNAARFYNRRMEMWFRMREWLKETGAIPNRDDLTDDLAAPTYSYDNRERMQLEKKEDMKARGLPSPDIADALALTFVEVFAPEPGLSADLSIAEPIEVRSPLDGF